MAFCPKCGARTQPGVPCRYCAQCAPKVYSEQENDFLNWAMQAQQNDPKRGYRLGSRPETPWGIFWGGMKLW